MDGTDAPNAPLIYIIYLPVHLVRTSTRLDICIKCSASLLYCLSLSSLPSHLFSCLISLEISDLDLSCCFSSHLCYSSG